MILFTILLLTLVVLTIITVVATSIVGAGAIVIFGDVIICALLLVWLIKRLFFKKRK